MNESHGSKDKLPRPLEGTRIVECGVWHAGPFAAAMLADLGAEVIKIETLTGDPSRFIGKIGPVDSGRADKPNWSAGFEVANRHKKGVCIDLTTEDGRKILSRLVEGADVFITNLRQNAKAKLGIDYQTLSRINPKLVHVNINGFGHKGAMRDVAGLDPVGQAMSGMMYLTGADEPVPLQTIIVDHITAIMASHAVLTALLMRAKRGTGQELHVSLYGSALWLLHVNLFATSVLKQSVGAKGGRSYLALNNRYKCQDGKWIMGANFPEQRYWPAFCKAIGRDDLSDDFRFATPELRQTHIEELISLLEDVLLTKSQAIWLEIFHAHGLLFQPIRELKEVLEDQQALINDYLVDYTHPSLGSIRIPGYPISFSANTAGTQAPAPDLGEHTASVLADLGYTSQDIDRLKAQKVIG